MTDSDRHVDILMSRIRGRHPEFPESGARGLDLKSGNSETGHPITLFWKNRGARLLIEVWGNGDVGGTCRYEMDGNWENFQFQTNAENIPDCVWKAIGVMLNQAQS